MVARRLDARANQRDGGAAMGCAGQTKILRRGKEMRRPIEEMAVRRWDAPAKRRYCSAARRCAGRSKRWRGGDGMRRPNEGMSLKNSARRRSNMIEEQRLLALDDIEEQRPLTLKEIDGQRPLALDEIRDDILKSSTRRREMIF